MTARNIRNNDRATTENMAFDYDVSPDISPAMETNTTTKFNSRFGAAPYHDQQAILPAVAPVSPCASDESSSVSIRTADIEYKYHVDSRVLGTGYHGSVRECIDRTTGQRFAVKSICKSDPAVKPGGLAREIMLLRNMEHENIVQLVDVYEDSDYVHLVTDLCKGGELFDKIVEKSSSEDEYGVPCFAEDDAARIMYQILTAVSYMHECGVVHRDIKPENILFKTKEVDSPVMIIDFGLAREHYPKFGEPPMSTIVGTPYYIAPDVLRKKYDKSCDLWSVGVIAYILLCGYPPFNGNNNREVYDAVRRGRYQFPSVDWSGTSRESRDFIRRLLQNDPSKRMTAEQALNHPWIVKNCSNGDVALIEDDNSSVEVVFHGMPAGRDSIICIDSPQRRRKTSTFVC